MIAKKAQKRKRIITNIKYQNTEENLKAFQDNLFCPRVFFATNRDLWKKNDLKRTKVEKLTFCQEYKIKFLFFTSVNIFQTKGTTLSMYKERNKKIFSCDK